MNTTLKNEWITLEEKYQTILKEKIEQFNLNNTNTVKPSSISSQLTFCTDGVQIKRYVNPDFNSGISVKSYKKTLAEMKVVDEFQNVTNEDLNVSIMEFGVEEFEKFEALEINEENF